MQPDDEICYCYHVSMRKLVSFARRERPSPVSRMTECLDAGTGCGWCIPFLVQIAKNPEAFTAGDLTSDEYAGKRKNYIETQPRNVFDDKNKYSDDRNKDVDQKNVEVGEKNVDVDDKSEGVEDRGEDVEEPGEIPPGCVSEPRDS